jgi:hypothetical protein
MIVPALLIAFILLNNNKKGLGALSVSKFYTVYIDDKINKQLRLKPSKNQKGVYILKKGNEIKYIGYSGSNLYKTLTRHFQSWEDRTQVRVTYNKNENIKARIVYTSTAAQAAKLEKALILKYKPTDNPNKYEQYSLNLSDNNLINNYQNEAEAPF